MAVCSPHNARNSNSRQRGQSGRTAAGRPSLRLGSSSFSSSPRGSTIYSDAPRQRAFPDRCSDGAPRFPSATPAPIGGLQRRRGLLAAPQLTLTLALEHFRTAVRPPAAGRRPAAYPSAAAGCPPAAGQPPEAGHPCAAVHPPVAGHLSPAGLHLGLRDAGREQLEGLRRAHTDGADRGDNSAVGVMGASKDPVWEFFTPGTRPKSFKCKFCQLELYGYPTVLKRHMVGSKCNPPAEVRRV